MSSRRLVLCLFLLIVAVGSGGVGAEAPDTIEGVTVEPDVKTAQAGQDIVKTAADALPGVEAKSHMAFLVTKDGTTWIVASDSRVQTGESVVKGDAYRAKEIPGVDFNIIFADSVETNTQGKSVPIEELRQNPEQYKWELVRVTGPYNQLAFNTQVGEGKVIQQNTFGSMGSGISGTSPVPPGSIGRWSVMNLSDNSIGASRSKEIEKRLGKTPDVHFLDQSSTRFWSQTKSHVDVVVGGKDAGSTRLYIADVTPVSESASVDEVTSGSHDGEVVTVDANAAYVKISTKQTLLKFARCGPDSVSNPATGCAPVITDAVVHGGVLYKGIPEKPEDMIVFAGVSNAEQDTAAETAHRRLKVTGEVVDGSEIAPAFAGMKAIVVFDIEPINHNQGGPPEEAVTQRDQFVKSINQQMNTSSAESSSSSSDDSGGSSDSGPQDSDGAAETSGSANFAILDVSYPAEQSGEITVEVVVKNTGDANGEFELTVTANGPDNGRSQLERIQLNAGETDTVQITLSGLDRESKYDLYVNNEHHGVIQPNPPLHEQAKKFKEPLALASGLIGVSGMLTTILLGSLVVIKRRRGRETNLTDKDLDWAAKISSGMFFTGIVLAIFSLWHSVILFASISVIGFLVWGLYEIV